MFPLKIESKGTLEIQKKKKKNRGHHTPFAAQLFCSVHKKDQILNEKQKEMAKLWLMNFMSNYLSVLLVYEADTEQFLRSFFKTNDVKAKVW